MGTALRSGSQGRIERSVAHSETRRPIEAIIINIVYLVFGFIAVILSLRFALRLLGANPDAGFVRLIYNMAAPFMAPFEAVFQTRQVEGAVFDWSVLLAIVIYLLIAWGIAALVRAVTPRAAVATVEHEEVVDRTTEAEGPRL